MDERTPYYSPFWMKQCVCDPSDEEYENSDGDWALLCECGAYDRWFDSWYRAGATGAVGAPERVGSDPTREPAP